MKIQFLIRSLGCGGAERQVVLLANHLSLRHDVSVVTFYRDENFFGRDLASSRVRFVTLEKTGRWDLTGVVRRFRQEVRATRPDVIYGFMNTAALLALTTRLPGLGYRPSIAWAIRSSDMDLKRYGWLPRLLRRIEVTLSPAADIVTSNSEAGRAHAIAEGFRADIVVIPNGIDTERFQRDPKAGQRLRAKWGVGPNARVIGIVGRHDPMKGYEHFLEAAAQTSARRGDAMFVAVGGGPDAYSDQLRRRATDLGLGGKLVWVKPSDSLVPHYSALDILTSASIYGEGFSNVLGEGMACGTPCVATRVGDAERILGQTGITVAPGDPKALSAAWQVLLDEPAVLARARGLAARQRIVNEFGDAQAANKTEMALASRVVSAG